MIQTAVEFDTSLLKADALYNNTHFLRAVCDMAQQEKVRATETVYASDGSKLLDQGAWVDAQLYPRLMQHRLGQPIDEVLALSNAVDVPTLEAKVMVLSATHPLGKQIKVFLEGQHHLMLDVLQYMKWPAQASFKMSVMRAQMPDLYEHSLLMMMVALSLAIKNNYSTVECAELAAAGLLHDVGMLYMPLSWMDPQHKLTPQEAKQLAAHSITAMQVVRSTGVYSRRVEDAVLEHHERLDGTGYPRGLRGDDISRMGRTLMLAEMVSAFYGKYQDMPAQRLFLALRMNHQRFDAALMQQVFTLLDMPQLTPGYLQTSQSSPKQVREVIASLAAIAQRWSSTKRRFSGHWPTFKGGRAGVYIDNRLQALEKSLAEAGSHPLQQVDWQQLFQEDPSSMTELLLINKEALWQIDNCVNTCIRRWPQVLQPSTDFEQGLHDWLVNAREILSLGKAPQNTSPSPSASGDAIELEF